MASRISFVRVLAMLVALSASACGESEGERKSDASASPPPSVPNAGEPVNVDLWLERLEVSSRELYSARANVVSSLSLSPGLRIADVGAGTGIYTLLFAETVGSKGVVYAVDIAPRFLTLINQRADDLGLDNVISVLSRPDSITLPPASVDAVFIADTYHYFDDPAAVMKTVREALVPGGDLYIVDFDLKEGATPASDKRHVRFGKAGMKTEVESYGFDFVEERSVEGLTDNYLLRFRRPE